MAASSGAGDNVRMATCGSEILPRLAIGRSWSLGSALGQFMDISGSAKLQMEASCGSENRTRPANLCSVLNSFCNKFIESQNNFKLYSRCNIAKCYTYKFFYLVCSEYTLLLQVFESDEDFKDP